MMSKNTVKIHNPFKICLLIYYQVDGQAEITYSYYTMVHKDKNEPKLTISYLTNIHESYSVNETTSLILRLEHHVPPGSHLLQCFHGLLLTHQKESLDFSRRKLLLA